MRNVEIIAQSAFEFIDASLDLDVPRAVDIHPCKMNLGRLTIFVAFRGEGNLVRRK